MQILASSLLLPLMLARCGAATRPSPPAGPEQALQLGVSVWDDTSMPVRVAPSACRQGEPAWLGAGHLYCFQVTETASYRFELAPQFQGSIQVQERDREHPWDFGVGQASAKPGEVAVVRVALDPGLYQVVIDGSHWPKTGYWLQVDRDTSSSALIGREDRARVAALEAHAEPLRLGERAFGVYRSTPGGARTSCGLVGGDAVRRLTLDRPARIRLRAAAHFPPAIEVRALHENRSLGCAGAVEGSHEAELVVDLPAGEHLLVLDSLAIARHHMHFETNGIMTGAYVVDAAEVAP